jgi:predicted DNA-binding transcriptional regulator YafY
MKTALAWAMRASRLLQILLLLQNRGRLSCASLARELEVTRRTILRDVDALTEAGLPVVVIRGNQGGIELGFNYRTRLTGFAADEVEALAVVLSQSSPALDELGMRPAAERAVAKLVESFTDPVREKIQTARQQFQFVEGRDVEPDVRIAALAAAIRDRRIVQINANTTTQQLIHPLSLQCCSDGWSLIIEREVNDSIPLSACGDISISAKCF